MKPRSSSKPRRVTLTGQVFSLSKAKTYLGRLVEKADRGEMVYIVRGHKRFILQEAPVIDPIPQRPPGFFKDSYTEADFKELNILAKASVVRAPDDIE